MLFFVYGGLMKQMGLSQHMNDTIYKGPAFFYADLYFLGQFPGVRPGKNKVLGEIYEINEKLVQSIDEVEEYYPDNIEKSVYIRKEIDAYNFADGKKIRTNIYWYNSEPKNNPLIFHGDYRRYIEEKQEINFSWIATYGLNINKKRLEKTVGTISEYKVGFLEGFQQVFNVKTDLNGYAYTNIKFLGSHNKCPAVVWKLNKQQINKLDKLENVPNLYHRISIAFNDINGEQINAQVYIANINALGKNLHPKLSYLKNITDALKEHNFNQ